MGMTIAGVNLNLQLIVSVGAVCMALMAIAVRMRAAKKPTNAKKILIPPLGMSTGFLMFVAPQTHIPWSYALLALVVGFGFAIPLIRTSHFEIVDRAVYLKRSKAFPIILLSLLVIRVALHNYVQEFISLPQTGAVFFILAFGMLLPWRIAMYGRYKKVRDQLVLNQ
jgi:membrane protein CcdC involved in cytochrome C biogenesis